MHTAMDDYQIPHYQLATRAIWQIHGCCGMLEDEEENTGLKTAYHKVHQICKNALSMTEAANIDALYIEKKHYQIVVNALKEINQIKIEEPRWSQIEIVKTQFKSIAMSVLSQIPN